MRSRSNRMLAILLSLLVAFLPLRGVFTAPADTCMTSDEPAHMAMQVAEQTSDDVNHACCDGNDSTNSCCQSGVDCLNHCLNTVSVITSNLFATTFIPASHPNFIQENLHADTLIITLYRPPRA